MKRRVLAFVCALLLCATVRAENAVEITAQTIFDATDIMTILEQYGAVSVDYENADFTEKRVYAVEDGCLLLSDTYTRKETNEVSTTCIVGNDMAHYSLGPTGVVRSLMTQEDLQVFFGGSLVNPDGREITVTEEENAYRALIATEQGTVTLMLEKETLLPVTMEQRLYEDTEGEFTLTVAFSYGGDIEADKTAAELYARQVDMLQDGLLFAAEDMDGNVVTPASFAGSSAIMVYLWEPWSRPCADELSDLQRLYEKYAGKGLALLGAFSETDMDNEARVILEDAGVTFPIVHTDSVLNTMRTGFVPTVFFLDANGTLLDNEPYVSSRSFEEWEQILLEVLGA